MLRNVPIKKLLDVLLMMEKNASHCDVDIDEEGGKILFIPLYDRNTLSSDTKIELPPPKKTNFDNKNLDDLIS
jgi:hypothetical protein